MGKGERGKEKGERRKEKGEPTTNRVQSSSLELSRCEGGKDRKAGLKESRRQTECNQLTQE